MNENASRHRVRRYIDEIGNCTMIAPASGAPRARPTPGVAPPDVNTIRFFANPLSGRQQTGKQTSPLSHAGKPATEARQGVISGRVLLVLLASTTLAVIALAVAYAVV
jgi:hypothetical protein